MTTTGEQRKLARSQLPQGARVIVAQRMDGRVALIDVPLTDSTCRV